MTRGGDKSPLLLLQPGLLHRRTYCSEGHHEGSGMSQASKWSRSRLSSGLHGVMGHFKTYTFEFGIHAWTNILQVATEMLK